MTETVVLQHRNALLREFLAERIAREPGLVFAGAAPTGWELIQLCERRTPSVAVFEADAPQWADGQLIALLVRAGPPVRMVGVHEELPASFYGAGISALVPYADGLRALLEVVKTAAPPVQTRRDGSALTHRELEVLRLLSVACPPERIAATLGISRHTVQNHKQRIYAKLRVHNQAQAAACAVRLGLAPASTQALHWQVELTPRERDILVSISSGRTTRQTASELGISSRTVENLQGNLFRKLRVHSRTAAFVAAHDLRLI
ncbi:DNA-binding response regulator, NarL/FixJ family, contains REC and HTH domains [Amycolatopsis xylanica]|uniref:DNA-binding response regulator, NarL/FixJ family, contains REC and HTH domains n=1 Tax=Amycolatopsis xylanica TaxID=589385 RepID=A0A1H3T343_9PSEU|nr:LuxR C-terminal-related transcriptional regulator [Amycolatopsis xylanica]SDZ44298.1 DNA-binding response regulator, NarL/FixJ family, contains REC and HTH domains [Amycolatopsis xylanica]